jgi:hypothetical protein
MPLLLTLHLLQVLCWLLLLLLLLLLRRISDI